MYRYWCHGSHMSADLKRVIHANRTARPDLFVARKVRTSSMGEDGKVTVRDVADVRAVPISAERRHRLSFQKDWY